MKISSRDRRALLLLGVALIAVLVVELVVRGREGSVAAAPADSAALAVKRLARLRQAAQSLPAREQALDEANRELAEREKAVIQADTLPQAQARLMEIARKLASAQSPPIDIRSAEVGQPRPLGEDYAEITVPLSFECRIEQLVNLLADVSAQPELVAVGNLRVATARQPDKTINVRLTLAGVVPRRLAPEKKGPGLL